MARAASSNANLLAQHVMCKAPRGLRLKLLLPACSWSWHLTLKLDYVSCKILLQHCREGLCFHILLQGSWLEGRAGLTECGACFHLNKHRHKSVPKRGLGAGGDRDEQSFSQLGSRLWQAVITLLSLASTQKAFNKDIPACQTLGQGWAALQQCAGRTTPPQGCSSEGHRCRQV